MPNGLGKRLCRIEQFLAGAPQSRVCNCRVETQFHNASCLGALLKIMPRDCPLHGFRELGFFLWVPLRCPLLFEDNQYCPCPPDPWRTFILSGVPRTRERHEDALEASRKIWGGQLSLAEDNNRVDAVLEKYWEARRLWIDKMGRQMPTRRELAKLRLKRLREICDEGRLPLRDQDRVEQGVW